MSDIRNKVVSAIQGNPVSPNTPLSLSLTVPATDILPGAAGPTNPTTPAGFTKETVNGVVSWRPFYQ